MNASANGSAKVSDGGVPTCKFCGKKGHLESKCWKKHGKPDNEKFLRKCWVCGSTEHVKKDCPKHKKKGDNGDAVGSDASSMNGIFLGMALCGDATESAGKVEKWLGDTGSQIHATGNVSVRVGNEKVLQKEPVKGCSGKVIYATKSGDVSIKTNDGVICDLKNIRIIPGLIKNIISINQLRSEGWKIEEGDKGSLNLRKNEKVLKFTRGDENNLYYIDAEAVDVHNMLQLENVKIVEKEYDEAHDQWGHHGINKLQAMARSQGIKLIGKASPCHACRMSKACWAKVSKTTTTKADKAGERFFVDTSGPFAGVAAGSKYLFGAVDDYSGKMFMMFGKHKSDLKDFVEKLFVRMKDKDRMPKYVRLDGGGENLSVRKSCDDKGIDIELTPPYTP